MTPGPGAPVRLAMGRYLGALSRETARRTGSATCGLSACSSFFSRRMQPSPALISLHGCGQGGEEPLGPDLVGQAESSQHGQQILLDPGQREHDSPVVEFLAD